MDSAMEAIEYKRPHAHPFGRAGRRILRVLCALMLAATLLLVFMGGLVTSHGAGMSVPDWPNSYGYNMFTFPPSKWVGGIFYEHTHRLMGTVVGMLAIATCIATWVVDSRNWVRWLSVGVLGAVIVQGILGGLRVILVQLNLAVVHACVAQVCLCLMVLLCSATSRWWMEVAREHPDAGSDLIRPLAIATGVIFAQLIVGALMRHYDAGLAVPDFPLQFGNILPPTSGGTLAAANEFRTKLNLPPVSMAQVWLHMGHRIGAVLVLGALAWPLTLVLREHRNRAISLAAKVIIVLVVVQLTLGVLTVLWKKPADIASLHVLVGALTLLMTCLLLIRTMRVYSPLWRSASRFLVVPVTPNRSMVPA
jgi:cytochrome c oxidase assembly protein subunit 15